MGFAPLYPSYMFRLFFNRFLGRSLYVYARLVRIPCALDPATARRSLAMQFYKWGDATPEHALDEWALLPD
jgi:hypothetical protein